MAKKIFAVCLILFLSGSEGFAQKLAFRVQPEVAHRELNKNFCWFHPRVAAIPGYGQNNGPAVIMTIQKDLVVSDFYSGMYFMRSDNLGKTWTDPVEIPELKWQYEADGTTISVADVTPGWHQKSGKLIAIGIKVRYSKEGKQLLDKPRSHDAAYSVFDPKTEKWTPWKMIANTPDADSKFFLLNPGCVQWLVKSDGTILLPVYFAGPHSERSSVTVLECSFDGNTLSYLRHGDELMVNEGRGLGEPSLAFYNHKYYLTLRNDFRAYVTTSNDGLHWLPIKEWTFDDGQELGSYNTQAHWLSHSNGLFLTYTRRGANNDHIARNRAPLFIAEVDPAKLQVIRSTEKVLIPERGVMLGNFGAAPINQKESWVTDAEFIVGDKPHPKGADGSVWVARVIWNKKNKLTCSH
ncbi:MAG: sialidase family protein [Bacteroidota bacterium]|nr:sialidase family protein [Bacteroidota bacterium]